MGSATATEPHGAIVNGDQSQSDTAGSNARLLIPNDKEKEKVHIACVECRSRKVKCGGEKPSCLRCERKESTCTYDEGPRRRGPDRRPGTRQRSAGGSALTKAEARKRKRAASVLSDKEDGETVLLRKKSKAQAPPHLSITTTSSLTNARSAQARENADQLSAAFGPVDVGQQIVILRGASNQYTPSPTSVVVNPPSLAISTALQPSRGIESSMLLPELPSAQYTRLARERPQVVSLPQYQHATFAVDPPPLPTFTVPSIIREPSLRFSRDMWWDTLISFYGPSRPVATQNVYDDLDHIFRISSVHFAFIHLPLFYSCIQKTEGRTQMQPALILSLLALATLLRSSELGLGMPGRLRALSLLEQAQSAFAASYNSGWIDSNLAQAAWIITQFEMSAHPSYSFARLGSALQLLDNTICVLQLTRSDLQNPDAPRFGRNQVPSIPRKRPTSIFPPISGPLTGRSANTLLDSSPSYTTSSATPMPSTSSSLQKCPCESLSLFDNAEAHRVTPLWLMTPKWPNPLSYHEILQEQDRRLVWSSLAIAAACNAAILSSGMPLLDLHIIRPENYALLFTGETLYASHPPTSQFSGKESTWALHSRIMLLLSVCPQVRQDRTMTSEQKGEFAFQAWVETMAIEEALNEHSCRGERSTLYQAREHLTTIRMFITHEYQHAIPIPQTGVDFTQYNRAKILQWLHHQNHTAAVIITGKFGIYSDTAPGLNLLATRPSYIFWFLGQAARCLQYWRMDRTLDLALDVSVKFMAVVDYLLHIWPCSEASRRATMVKFGLSNACRFAGKILPPPDAPPIVQSFLSDI